MINFSNCNLEIFLFKSFICITSSPLYPHGLICLKGDKSISKLMLRPWYDLPLDILNPIDAIPIAKELKAFAINPNHKKLSYNIVKEIQLDGFKVFTWTVNDTNRISELISWGVDAIITDHPEYVIR